ncbi:[FeFe] hydrogenase H-cluster maturation GTPase HydF [Desulfovibrio inopinatus]|uniref:[FeFe] hydrogenase H-cluster maturation GTPase HydF n=1 Tax=Desulfovibrio inopinatus TaxID=102109 RepID=UPI000488244F|nr:[FeFe] hydrogenase H-cluster maturation GTPase HydF [Desulfovibrio inopinatus]
MSDKAPKGVRMVISLVGRRNVGKSSLINAIAGQEIAIVSDHPGTTTDPVGKHYELLPLGPVTFYDTAGLDDSGELGELRIKATHKVLYRTDIALLVIGLDGIGDKERDILSRLDELNIATLVIFNKTDIASPRSEDMEFCTNKNLSYLQTSTSSGEGIDAVKKAIIASAPREFAEDPVLVSDFIQEGNIVLCVVPIDLAAPKGRLILPQVQVLRDVLDSDALGMVVKERELEEALIVLQDRLSLVVTDSQVVLKVAGDVPDHIAMTTFSILFARYKGDLRTLVQGARKIDALRDGDKILMCEACSHHAVADDIGRVKIPRWMTQYTGKNLEFVQYTGHDFPQDLEEFSLAVHCGGCMINRTEMLRRVRECMRRNVPITNYGVAISKIQGVLDRVVKPFNL